MSIQNIWPVPFRINGGSFPKNRLVVKCFLYNNFIRTSKIVKYNLEADWMAHWIKALATKPRLHIVEGEDQPALSLASCL